MVLPISTTHDQPAHHMLELNLLEFAEWLLADGSNFSLFQETSHYIPIIINYHPLYFIIFQSDSHYIPFIYPQIFLTYPEIPLVSSNILKLSSLIIWHPQISSIIPQIPLNTPKYSSDIPQIFLTYSSYILKYPLISSNILKYHLTSSNILKYSSDTLEYPQIFLRYSSNIPQIFFTYSSHILKYPLISSNIPQISGRWVVTSSIPTVATTFPRSRDRHAAANAGAAGGWKATEGGGTWAMEAGFFLVGGLEHDFYFPFHIWDNPSHWLIFFKMVKT